jgi:hypothetical protein
VRAIGASAREGLWARASVEPPLGVMYRAVLCSADANVSVDYLVIAARARAKQGSR